MKVLQQLLSNKFPSVPYICIEEQSAKRERHIIASLAPPGI